MKSPLTGHIKVHSFESGASRVARLSTPKPTYGQTDASDLEFLSRVRTPSMDWPWPGAPL